MTPLYQSRQIAWFLIVFITVIVIFLTIISAKSSDSDLPLWLPPMLLFLGLPFTVMNVTVTREHVRITFLVGFPRKTVGIGDVKSCEAYRAEGLQRFQTQVKPSQGRSQLSGAGGVVIVRNKGIPLTVSDPEPDKIARAVARARAKHEQLGRT